jgi:hypothetical protein
MTLYIDPAQIVWGAFDALEPSRPEWTEQFAYWDDYVEKFFRSNGLPFSPGDSNVENWLMAPDRAPFAEMVRHLLPRLSERADLSGTEAILFAHWLPDLHMGTSVTNFAMHQLALSSCFGFAISDRGLSAPFFAFDTLYKYLKAKNGPGLLLIADQKHLLYKSSVVDSLAPKNAAAAVRLDPSKTAGFAYRGYRRVALEDGANGEADLLIGELVQQFGLDADRLTVIGPDALIGDCGLLGVEMIVTDETLVCSAPFAAFADNADLSRDWLLLCRDARHVTALAFGGRGG